MKDKRVVRFFISYAHANNILTKDFIDKFMEISGPAKHFRYELWHDGMIDVGEKWEEAIQNAIRECDFGMLLISTAFLGSKYIIDKELPHYFISGKHAFPVMLANIDFDRHDLNGLEAHQIYQLNKETFTKPRSYSYCKGQRREDFVMDFFAKVDDWLMGHLK